MATELGSAFISVGLGTNTLAGDIKKAFGSAESSGGDAGKSAGKGFGSAFGVAATALAGLGIGSFFKSAIGGAGDLEQSVGAIDSVFKGSAGQMHEWANSAATDVGLSANEFNELGTLIGSQLKNGGTAMDELGPKTKELISTGADLASMFGGTTSEAVDALSSALKGERDPIEKYGVSLNQAKIDAEAAALGFGKVNGAFDQSAQQAATLSLITKQTADATGNFGRETDTLAHKQQVLNAQIANGKARIGTELLPVVSALTGALSKALGPAINGTVAAIKTVVGGFTAFGAAFKAADGDITSNGFAGVMERIGFAASKLVDIGKTLWAGFKMDPEVAASFGAGLNPLLAFGQTVRGIFDQVTFAAKTLWAGFNMPPDVVAGIGANINPLLEFGAKVREAVTTLTTTAKTLWAGFTMPPEVAAGLGDKINPILNIGVKLREFFDGVGAAIGPLIAQIIPLASAFSPMQIIFKAIEPLLPQLGDMFMQLATILGGSLLNILTTLTPMFVQLSGVVSEALGGVIAAVLPTVVTMITMLGKTIGELLPIITPIIATLIELATTLIGQLMPIITDLVASILPPLVDIFGNILSAIGPVITMVAGVLIPVIMALMPVVVTVFGVIANVIKTAMQIVQGIIQVVTGLITGNWGQVWEGIVNIFSGIWNTIVAVIGGAMAIVWSVIQAGLQLAWGVVTSVLGSIGQFFIDVWNNIVGFLGDVWNNIVNGVIAAVTWYFTTIFNAFTAVWTFIGDVFNNILRFFSDTWNNIVNGVSGAVRGYFTIVSNGFNLVLGFVKSVLGNIGSFFSDTWNNIVNGATGMIDNVVGFFSGLGGKIMGALGDIGSTLFNTGKNIIQGLIDGIGSMMGSIGRAVLNIVPEAIRGPFEDLLGIHSPSRVFRGYGVNIGQGLILGLDDMHGDISNAVTGMVSVPSVPSISAGSYTPAGSALAGASAGSGFANYGTIHVRDENEMARLILTKQQDAQAVYQ